MIMGHIFKTAVPDESDEDRRELERCVMRAHGFSLFLCCTRPDQDGGGSSHRQV